MTRRHTRKGNTLAQAAMAAALTVAVAGAASAFTSEVPPGGLPSASHYSAALLPEKEGIVPWRTLAQVRMEQVGLRVVNQFSSAVLALDQKDVKLQGFVIPLELGDAQKRFLLSAVPSDCPFCMPAGPEALVEVVTAKPVKYGLEPIVVSGRLSVLKDDETGLLYRLTAAQSLGPAK